MRLIASVVMVLLAGVSWSHAVEGEIFSDDFEWGSICAWSNLWYPDFDEDLYGDAAAGGQPFDCPELFGFVANNQDCDDINPLINPAAVELCDFVDNDCDLDTVDGFGEPWFADLCDGGDSDLCDEGTFQCSDGVQVCSDESNDDMEMCNTVDDDCNPLTTDGADEPWYGDSCDGPDGDLCDEGISTCLSGSQSCNDASGDTPDICNGVDDDCDPASADGSEDPLLGAPCDGIDTDLCYEGTNICSGGSLSCSDNTGSELDLCDGIDNDCDPASADGSEDPFNGTTCDGTDSDLCDEGTNSCIGGSLLCSDNTAGDLDVCDGIDNDCDPASADGSEDPFNGTACDGTDSDLCDEGTNSCIGGSLLCSDNTAGDLDLCDGIDNDCDPGSADGSEDPFNGTACDTGSLGICSSGTALCSGGSLTCEQDTAATAEICDGLDNDCDGAEDDGNPGGGAGCDTGLPGMCSSGTTMCSGGSLTCEQDTAPTAEVCDGLDNDCDGAEDDGNPGGGAPCITGLPGVCSSGTTMCSGGSLTCEQDTAPTAEVCDGLDNDCDGAEDDGNPGGGGFCNTGLQGVCAEGTIACVGGGLQCFQDEEPSEEVCNDFVDNDCNGETDCDDAICDSDPWCQP